MVSRLTDNLPRQARVQFYSPSLQSSLYAHRNYLMGVRRCHEVTVDPNVADRYRGDFIGLLILEGIPIDLHPIICELNNLLDPTDYDGTMLNFLVPFQEDVNEIAVRHKALDT